MHRQKRMPFGWLSISVRIVEPVVVKADMDSKRELRGEIPSSIKGIAPKTAASKPAQSNNRKTFFAHPVLFGFVGEQDESR